MALLTEKDETENEKLIREAGGMSENDGKDHLRADLLGSIAGSNPNDPKYLGRIDNVLTGFGSLEKPSVESFEPGSRKYDLAVGATSQPRMKPPVTTMAEPPNIAPPTLNALMGRPTLGPDRDPESDPNALIPTRMGQQLKPGLLGRIGRVASKMGNIAGAVLAPGVMMNIPGTDLNKRMEASLAERRSEKDRQLSVEESRADTEAAKEKREAAAAGQPKPKEEEWTIAKDYAGPNGEPVEIEKNSGTLRIAGSGISGIKRVNEKPDTETQEAQRYEGIKQAQTLKQPVSPEDQAWAGAYEKRKTLAPFASAVAQAPQKSTERSDKSFQYNNTALDKVSTPVEQAQARMGRLSDAIVQNTPQADALIAPELLSVMAGGAGSGLRMNEAEINRIVGGRSKWESLKAAVNQWSLDPSKATSITPEQRQEIRALTTEVQRKLTAKQQIIDDARNALIDSDDPKEHRRIVADAKKKMDAIDAGGGAERKWQKNDKGEYRYSDDGGKTWQNQTK